MNYIQKAKERLKLDYINPNIAIENFPEETIRGKVELFNFNKYVSSEQAIKLLDEKGYVPANLTELLTLDWTGRYMIALGSVWQDSGGNRDVPCLGKWRGLRVLGLDCWDGAWYGIYFFAAVSKLSLGKSESSDSLTLDSLDARLKKLEKMFNPDIIN